MKVFFISLPRGQKSQWLKIFLEALQDTYLGCLDIMSTHASSTYDYDPNVNTSEFNNPKTFRPCDIKSQKWTDCLSNQNCDTKTPKKVGRSVTAEHYDPVVF